MKPSKLILTAIIYLIAFNSLLSAQTGNITYTLHKEQNPTADQLDAYAKIKTAMDSATGYYNKYTSISKNLNVYYNTGVQTADASSNGTMRFGSSRSYMVVHTAMHEIAHTVGIGTTTEYKNLIKNGVFTGTLATAKLKEILGSDSILKGDGTHFWPFGLNYASEVKSAQDFVNHCLIVNEMYKDMFGVESFYKSCYLKSKSDGKYIVVSNNTLALDDTPSSAVRLIALNGENLFRLEFGDKVLDIPNESRDPGVAAGLYSWNGGAHQRAIFEFDPVNSNIARIKMSHSGLYLRANGNRIIQDQPSASVEKQYWELIDDKTISRKNKNSILSEQKIWFRNNRLSFDPSISNCIAEIRITDLSGQCVRSELINTDQELVLNNQTIAKGVYVITVNLKNQFISSRLLVK